MRIAPLVVLWCLSSSCLGGLAAPTPMASLKNELAGAKAKCLVVFLPGAGDRAEDFDKYGFVSQLRARQLSVDVVSAQATIGYYMSGSMHARTHVDVVEPAVAKGYEQVWVMGMSMGGMGTLMYSHEHPELVTGAFAIAPFLGDGSLIEEIRSAGGLAKWQAPPKAPLTSSGYQKEIWRWLQGVTAGTEKGPNLYLAWSTEDNLATADQVLAAALPADHVISAPGRHKWTTWQVIFEKFLSDSDFSRACAP